MVTLIFTYDPKTGRVQVKTKRVLKPKFFVINMSVLSSFASGFQKKVICLGIKQFEMRDNVSKKVASP